MFRSITSLVEAKLFLFLTQCFRDVGRVTHIRQSVLTDIATSGLYIPWLYKLSLWWSERVFYFVSDVDKTIKHSSWSYLNWVEYEGIILLKHIGALTVDLQLLTSVCQETLCSSGSLYLYPIICLSFPDSGGGSRSSLPAAPKGISFWPFPYSRGRGRHSSRVQDLQGFHPGTLWERDIQS